MSEFCIGFVCVWYVYSEEMLRNSVLNVMDKIMFVELTDALEGVAPYRCAQSSDDIRRRIILRG